MKLCLLALLLFPTLILSGASVFTVKGRQIHLNGEPFHIKGVCYNAASIGETGTETPYGDYYTDNYLSLTERDAKNLRKLGANVQRSYGWTPGENHKHYLDRAYNNAEQSVYMFINRWIDPHTDWGNAAAVEEITKSWMTIVEETKDHPAIIGYLLGNEHNNEAGNGANPLFWQAMETIAAAVKKAAPGKLVSVPITDRIDEVTQVDATLKSIDFWSIQVYRSTTLGTFFEEYKTASSKPVVLTEYGYDAFDNNTGQVYPDNATYQAEVVESMISEINSNSDVCAGGCIFEYRDEWWKSKGSIHEQDPGGFPALGMPDKVLNEEWWGIYSATKNGELPDKLSPRMLKYRLEKLWATH
jgi:beta-galactosidase/beta-glucuronidase